MHIDVYLCDTHAIQFGAALHRCILDGLGRAAAVRQKIEPFGKPITAGDHGCQKQQQGEIAFDGSEIPSAHITRKGGKHQRRENLHGLHQSSTCKIARKASWGTSTDPICFIRFLPAFCFSSSLRLREMSPP